MMTTEIMRQREYMFKQFGNKIWNIAISRSEIEPVFSNSIANKYKVGEYQTKTEITKWQAYLVKELYGENLRKKGA